ncbi:hypothetical protein JTE90_011652 [Oedothorax gibbosus]|uniref:SAM domain-containing protein n=1 Tax=Oedothorax gibbosus TaxID=931172 RepID=A0AAV6U247_9ARAC|nr:hypothetical protein JTE90_011652 [Oedothorax gibbosus]
MTDILKLCQYGDFDAVEKFLYEGVDPNFQNNEGESPLQIASANGYCEIVKLLLNSGASIDLPNNYGWTPLMQAAKHGHSLTVAFLLKMKAKVNITNKLGMSPIVAAAWSGDLLTLKLLMAAGAMVDHMSALCENNEGDLSSLMAAALQGHEDILRFLLDQGALINHVSPITGLSPLMLAAFEGHLKMTQVIVDFGGNINNQDICNRSALDWAIENNKEEVRDYLETLTISKLKTGKSESINILQAVRNGDILGVECAIKENSDNVNFCGPNDGITPLMLASMLGQNNIINLLTSNGANLDAQDIENGWTALMYAVFHGHADSVQILLEKGAAFDVCASNGYTAMDLAHHTDSSDTSIIECLTAKLMSLDLITRKSFINSPSVASGKQKLSGSERFFPKKSQTQAGLKKQSWIGGLQSKMLTRLSPRYSEKLSTSDIQAFDETMVNDVFVEPKSPFDEIEYFKNLSPDFLPPDKHLADLLKEHKVEAIKPPLKVFGYSNYFPFGKPKDKEPKDKDPKDKEPKPIKNSLHLKYLLRDHYRKRHLVHPTKAHQSKDIHSVSMSLMDTKHQPTEFFNEKTNLISPETPALEQQDKEIKTNEGDLSELLMEDESLGKYIKKFQEQEIDINTLKHLSKEDLYDIGVETIESQEKILKIIEKLRCT